MFNKLITSTCDNLRFYQIVYCIDCPWPILNTFNHSPKSDYMFANLKGIPYTFFSIKYSKQSPLTFCLTLLLIMALNAKGQTRSGNLDRYLQNRIDQMPGAGQNDYRPPAAQNRQAIGKAIENLLSGKIVQARNQASAFDYEVLLFSDTSQKPTDSFYLLQAEKPVKHHWGLYAFSKASLRPSLILQAPHPKFDLNTGDEAVFCFKRLKARALFLSSVHRCNHTDTSTCSGTTTVCDKNPSPYRISDMAHVVNSGYQEATATANRSLENPVFIQFHGFARSASEPYGYLSNGTRQKTNKAFANQMAKVLKQTDSVLTFGIAHRDTLPEALWAFNNVQGRLINNSPAPCTQNATTGNGQFLHVEQELSRLRSDSTGWRKMLTALRQVFPASLTSKTDEIMHRQKPVKLYPNPARNSFAIHCSTAKSVKVEKPNGLLVKEWHKVDRSHPRFRLPFLTAGTYIVKIRTANNQVVKKLILLP